MNALRTRCFRSEVRRARTALRKYRTMAKRFNICFSFNRAAPAAGPPTGVPSPKCPAPLPRLDSPRARHWSAEIDSVAVRNLCSSASAAPASSVSNASLPRAKRKSQGSSSSGSVRITQVDRLGDKQLEQLVCPVATGLVTVEDQHDSVGVTPKSCTCRSPNAVPRAATAFVNAKLLCHQAVGVPLHNDCVFCLMMASRAKSRPYSRLLLAKSGVSREFRYLAAGVCSPDGDDTSPETHRPALAYRGSKTAPGHGNVSQCPGPFVRLRTRSHASRICGVNACHVPGPRSTPTRRGRNPGGIGERFRRKALVRKDNRGAPAAAGDLSRKWWYSSSAQAMAFCNSFLSSAARFAPASAHQRILRVRRAWPAPREIELLHLHHEAKDVAADITHPALERLPLRIDLQAGARSSCHGQSAL